MESDLTFYDHTADNLDWFDGLQLDPNDEPSDEALALIEAELVG